MAVTDLPLVNAVLNGTAFLLLCGGFAAIRNGKPDTHKKFMVAALAISAIFLISYLVYHFQHGSTRFPDGPAKPLYLTILISHTALAIANVPLVIFTVRHAIRGELALHRKWAKITLPVWMYVSLTGVIIYMMLYQWFAPGTSA